MPDGKLNYLRNTKTSTARTVRLEIVGDISEKEKHFLNGISLFVAGTLSKNDSVFTTDVSLLLANLVRSLVAKIQQGREQKETLNPFKDFYKETAGPALADAIPMPWHAPKDRDTTADANRIKPTVNTFVHKQNVLIGELVEEERLKGTRADLILTAIVGGLAFTLANAYHLITQHFKVRMTTEEFKDTFNAMYDTAISNTEKNEKHG